MTLWLLLLLLLLTLLPCLEDGLADGYIGALLAMLVAAIGDLAATAATLSQLDRVTTNSDLFALFQPRTPRGLDLSGAKSVGVGLVAQLQAVVDENQRAVGPSGRGRAAGWQNTEEGPGCFNFLVNGAVRRARRAVVVITGSYDRVDI